jgi:UDP-N-acetylmuramoyl-tripeptide--D-alanyl-D-alanine ligase
MKLSIKDLELLAGAEVVQSGAPRGRRLTGVSTDSRTVAPGNLFIALRGEKFDGHAFAVQAAADGAAAVMVDAAFDAREVKKTKAAVVVVPDTTKALGQLALMYRMKFDIPVIAVGGSNGKTTTKEMITAVLRERYTVLSTEGNLNNHIGVPLMLFRLAPSHTMAVLELGTNHFGELQYLCSIALPTHAVVTNIGREHLEFFADLKGVAEEETELYRFMDASFGAAFVNADDPYLTKAAKKVGNKLFYGTAADADVRAGNVAMTADGRPVFDCTVKTLRRPQRFTLGASGMHNVSNALAAIAVGTSFGIPLKAAKTALAEFTSASKRMEILVRNGLTILNDTYNANPDSMLAALRTLMSMKSSGKKIAVLGDMKELGGASEREHAAIGRTVRSLQPDVLVTYGALAAHIAATARLKKSYPCATKEQAIDVLSSVTGAGDTVLVKGSRSMAMEDIVAHL